MLHERDELDIRDVRRVVPPLGTDRDVCSGKERGKALQVMLHISHGRFRRLEVLLGFPESGVRLRAGHAFGGDHGVCLGARGQYTGSQAIGGVQRDGNAIGVGWHMRNAADPRWE
jgi:hypothetical protein